MSSQRHYGCCKPTAHSLTHSLLRLTSEGHSDLHAERSWICKQITWVSQCWSMTTCSHVFRGRPGGHFQPAVRLLPFMTLVTYRKTVWAGVFPGRRMMWPKIAAIRYDQWKSTSFVCSLTESLVIKSYQLICRMRHCAFLWNACRRFSSSCFIVHSSDPYNRTDCTTEV